MRFGAGWRTTRPAPGGSEVPLMAMDARPKLLRYQTLNPGVGSGRDANAWPYLPTLLPRFAGHSSECLMLFCSPYVCGVSHMSHVLFAAYHKARPSRAINEDVYYYYYCCSSGWGCSEVGQMSIDDGRRCRRRPAEWCDDSYSVQDRRVKTGQDADMDPGRKGVVPGT